MRDKDAVQLRGGVAQQGETARQLAAGDAGIHQQRGAAAADQRAVAGGATGQGVEFHGCSLSFYKNSGSRILSVAAAGIHDCPDLILEFNKKLSMKELL